MQIAVNVDRGSSHNEWEPLILLMFLQGTQNILERTSEQSKRLVHLKAWFIGVQTIARQCLLIFG